MQILNLKLTNEELTVLKNTEFLRVKHLVIQKTVQLFDNLGDELRNNLKFNDINSELGTSYKISRGENFKGFPYVVLDYPKIRTNSDPVLFRTILWWGNYISLNVLIRDPEKNLQEKLINRIDSINKEWMFYSGSDPWDHNLDSGNYFIIKNDEELKNQVNENILLKISRKISLENWEKIPEEALENYKKIKDLIC